MLAIDNHGFEEMDKKLLRTIIDKFAGGPVGIGTIAAAISEEIDAIEDIFEPFLIQKGFLAADSARTDCHAAGLSALGLSPSARQMELIYDCCPVSQPFMWDWVPTLAISMANLQLGYRPEASRRPPGVI